jgi:transcriptional regulator with XRE-family HTH domain
MAPRRQRLAQRRKAVGFTQEVFAERLGVECSTVVRWEAGDTEPSPWRRPKIARLLQVSLNRLEELLEQTSEPTFIDAPHVLPNFAPLASANADASAIHGFRAADKQVGGGHLYATVVSYLHTEVGPRLFGCGHEAEDRLVFTAAAALTEMAGWMAHDAGKDTAAWQHFDHSLDLVTIGGDRQLGAHILGSMSHLAHHGGQPEKAMQLARRGHKALHGGPPQPQLQARLLTMHARGSAALGHREDCTRLLIQAEKTLDAAPAERPSPWVSHFDEASLASETARCMRHLGDLSQAQRQAERIIELRPDTGTRSRAFGQLLLVTVLIAQGKPEQACAIAHDVLTATQSLGSYQVIHQLVKLNQLLEHHRANMVVADFLACLQQTLRERAWLYQWFTKDQRGHSAGLVGGP